MNHLGHHLGRFAGGRKRTLLYPKDLFRTVSTTMSGSMSHLQNDSGNVGGACPICQMLAVMLGGTWTEPKSGQNQKKSGNPIRHKIRLMKPDPDAPQNYPQRMVRTSSGTRLVRAVNRNINECSENMIVRSAGPWATIRNTHVPMRQ